jgi:hypothetical protein
MPTSLLYNRNVSPAVRDTWLQIRGLAWGATVTPEITMESLTKLTGKSQSTIFEHMRLLGKWNAIRWHTPRKQTFIFEFDDNEKINAVHSEKLEFKIDSENLELLPLDPSPKNNTLVVPEEDKRMSFRKVGMDNPRKPDTVPAEILKPIVDILAAVTQMDKTLNYSRLAKEAKALHLAGYTHEQIKITYGEGGKWYLCDWRGMKGERPELGTIRASIYALLAAIPSKNGSRPAKTHETAQDIIARRRAAIEQKEKAENGN